MGPPLWIAGFTIIQRIINYETALVSTVVHHFRAQFFFPGATAVGRPCKSRIADLAGLGEVRELRQHPRQHRFIAPAVVGRAEGAAHWMVDKDRARRRDLADNIEGRARQQCRNAVILNHMGNETDGLVAKGSVGHEQREVHMLLRQFNRDGRCQFVFYLHMLAQPAHERKVPR